MIGGQRKENLFYHSVTSKDAFCLTWCNWRQLKQSSYHAAAAGAWCFRLHHDHVWRRIQANMHTQLHFNMRTLTHAHIKDWDVSVWKWHRLLGIFFSLLVNTEDLKSRNQDQSIFRQWTVQSQDLELNPSVFLISSLQISVWGLKTCEYKWILYETDFVLSPVWQCAEANTPQNGVKLNPICVYQHRCLSTQRRAFTYFGCFCFVSAAVCLIVSAAPQKVCFSSVFSP